MRFSVGSAQLAAAVSYAAKLSPSRPAHPVHAGVRVTVTNDEITILGMDPGSGSNASALIPARAGKPGAVAEPDEMCAIVSSPGEILLQGKLFSDVVSNVKGQVEVFLDGTRVRVTAGKAKFALRPMPLEEYPASMDDASSSAGTAVMSEFVRAVELAALAVDFDAPVPILAGIYVEFDGKRITFAGTDRYRLSALSIPWTNAVKGSPDRVLTLPAKVLADAAKGLAKDGDELTISFAGEGILILTGATRTAKITTIAGEYPQWRALYPKAVQATTVVDGKSALATLNRVSIVSEKNEAVALLFGEELVKFRAGRAGATGGEDELIAKHSGASMEVLFNPGYLRDGFAACGASEVTVSLEHPNKPAVLSPNDGSDFRYLVMAVRAAA